MHLVAIDVDGRDPELVADRCWQAGATGLWEVGPATLRAGVEPDRLDGFLRALADLGPVDVTEAEAVELAGRRSTVSAAGHEIDLWVPATVFGDGTHPTTVGCLELLPRVVGVGDRVLDVGCGAGALAVAAALLGARVVAVDIDAVAFHATADNAVRNGVAIDASPTPLVEVAGVFEVVVANLTVGSLAGLVADLVSRTRPGGALILSGMLEEQWPEIRDAAGGTVEQVGAVDGWVTALVTRRE